MAKATAQVKGKNHKNEVKVIDKAKTKKGRLIRVYNEGRKFGAGTEYVAVWVEDANGKRERCLLFSASQIQVAEERALKNKEDLTKKTFFTDFVD